MLAVLAVVTATVNQKNEFKIVCQSLDLQTGKGALKATGKVQITGDMMTGSCDVLGISLSEDRLLLEGNALVSIQKLSRRTSSFCSSPMDPETSIMKTMTALDLGLFTSFQLR